MNLIKVAAASRTSAVAGAIAGVIREHQRAEVQAIGAGAVNQAMKAIIVAASYLNQENIHICCVPQFTDVIIDDHEKTAIKLIVEPQHLSVPPTESTRLSFQPGASTAAVSTLDPSG